MNLWWYHSWKMSQLFGDRPWGGLELLFATKNYQIWSYSKMMTVWITFEGPELVSDVCCLLFVSGSRRMEINSPCLLEHNTSKVFNSNFTVCSEFYPKKTSEMIKIRNRIQREKKFNFLKAVFQLQANLIETILLEGKDEDF